MKTQCPAQGCHTKRWFSIATQDHLCAKPGFQKKIGWRCASMLVQLQQLGAPAKLAQTAQSTASCALADVQ
jgi:hypothetical protein